MTKDIVNEYGITPVKVGFSQEVHKRKSIYQDVCGWWF